MKTPYLVNVLNNRQKFTLNLLILCWLAAVIWFLCWWVRPEHFVNLSRWIYNSLIVCWTVVLPGWYFYFLRRMKKPNPALEIPQDWRIAMIVTKVPVEPWELVKRMLEAMLAQRLPHDTWLADEDPTPETYNWCAEHGVKISCRKGVEGYHNKKWPRREKCKEGNLSYFYDNWGYRDYDFVSQMDADHIPAGPEYLTKMMQGFCNPKVGYVSAPSINDQNIKDSWISRGRIYMESTMHGTLQAGYNGGWTPMCIGSHYAVRTAALKEVGGLGPELAEDHSTSLILAANGWEGVHSIDAIAHGDGPNTFTDCMFQEFQWARSLVMITVNITPKLLKRMTPRLIFQFLFAQSWYFLFAVTMLLAYSLAPLALVTNKPFTNMYYFDYVFHVMWPTICCLAIVKWLGTQGLLRPKYSKVFAWETVLFQMARWPYITIALYDAFRVVLTKKYLVWKVTPKETGNVNMPFRYMYPYVTIVVLCGAVLLWNAPHITQIGYFCLTSLTVVWYSTLIWAIPFLHRKEAMAALGETSNAQPVGFLEEA